jgi:hypothetical protein
MTYGLGKCARKTCGKSFTRKTQNHEYCSITCQRLIHDKKRGKMRCGAFVGSPPQRRVLNLLKKGPQTTLEIQQKARVCNPATWISSLRQNGFNIPDAEYKGRDEETGIRIFSYRLIERGAK